MSEQAWLLMTYKVPSEPARKRIALWRKLKSVGALYLQNGVCLLPKRDEHLRRLKILQNEIREMGGEAVLLETTALDASQDERILQRFNAERDEQYGEFLGRCRDFHLEVEHEIAARHLTYAELDEIDEDLQKLQGWLEKIKKLDFYGAPLAVEAEGALEACQKELDAFALLVFEQDSDDRASDEQAPTP